MNPYEEEEKKVASAKFSPAKNLSKNRIQNNDAQSGYTPIAALSTFLYEWMIKGRLVKKYPIKTWTRDGNQGKLLNFEIVDQDGTSILCTLFS